MISISIVNLNIPWFISVSIPVLIPSYLYTINNSTIDIDIRYYRSIWYTVFHHFFMYKTSWENMGWSTKNKYHTVDEVPITSICAHLQLEYRDMKFTPRCIMLTELKKLYTWSTWYCFRNTVSILIVNKISLYKSIHIWSAVAVSSVPVYCSLTTRTFKKWLATVAPEALPFGAIL